MPGPSGDDELIQSLGGLGLWPPTYWYADWVSGLDVFDVGREGCPVEMRWLVYEKPSWDGRPT